MTKEYIPMFPRRNDNWGKPEMTDEELEKWLNERIIKDKNILDALGKS